MSDSEQQPNDLPGFLLRRPTLQYLLLAAIGILGIYLSMPLGLEPQSSIEWVDLVINMIILVPSVVLGGAGTVLAALSAASPNALSADGWPARLTSFVLRSVGIPRAIVPEVAVLGPLGLLLRILWDRSSESSLPEHAGGEDSSEP